MKNFHKVAKRIFWLVLFGFMTSAGAKPAGAIAWERRAVFELGSGSIRLLVADYDPGNNRIVDTIYTDKVYFKLAKYLSDRKNNETFSEELMQEAMDKVQYLKGKAVRKGAIKFSGIATSSFRQAKNGGVLVNKINAAANINLKLVTQREEGLCAFYSVEHILGSKNAYRMVLDIGGGSLQLTAKNNLHDFIFITRELGAEFAKNSLLRIQGKAIHASIYPVSKAEFFALKAAIVSKLSTIKLNAAEKEALRNAATGLQVVGTCKNLIPTILEGEYRIEKAQLLKAVFEHLNQPAKEIEELYAHKLKETADTQFILSNAALLLALGEYLQVDNFSLLALGDNTHGILLQPDYWQ